MAKLILQWGGESREIPLDKLSFTAGRAVENDLTLQDNLLSRQHLAIRRENGQYVLHDMGSTNGTFVNDERVTRRLLTHGDVVRFGDATLHFVDEAAVPSPAVASSSSDTPITRLAASGEIVRHIDDIAEPLSLDIGPESLKSSSLDQISRSLGGARERKETAMFFILYQVCKAVGSAVTIEEILKTSIRLAFDVIRAERGAIILREPGAKTTRVGIAYHRKKGEMPADSIPISQTIVQRVIDERVALISHDTLTDPDFKEAVSIVNLAIRSALCVPLWEGENVYGAFYLDNRAASYAFTQPDLELLTAIANLVAIRLRQEHLNDALRREEVLRTELLNYFSPDVAELIIKGGDQLSTKLAQREVTVAFIDIEGSTPMAERLGPDAISQTLGWFYEAAANAIFEHKGNINNFIGDAVMGIYNAPLEVPDHALAAVKSAVKLLKDIHARNRGAPADAFNVRVGINTGTVMAGDVGSRKRHFTALGDPVNVAERLTRFPQVNTIIVGPETHRRIKGAFECRELGLFKLKGTSRDIPAYQVVVPT